MATQGITDKLAQFDGILAVVCLDAGDFYRSDRGLEFQDLLMGLLGPYLSWEKIGPWRLSTPKCAVLIDDDKNGCHFAVAHIPGHPIVKSLTRMVRRSLKKVEKQHAAMARVH